jgi:Ca2+-binding EF-hand superfamily protein
MKIYSKVFISTILLNDNKLIMDDDEISYLEGVFNKYDIDKDGSLTSEEFLALVQKLSEFVKELEGVDPYAIKSVFKYYDMDGDGKLNFDEICDWWMTPDKYSLMVGESGALISKANKLYSKYAKGSQLTYDEFEVLLTSLKVSHQESAFDNIDVNGDGLMNFYEFFTWLDWV